MTLDLQRFYFTDDNTEGFSQETLDKMNSDLCAALEDLAQELFDKTDLTECDDEDDEQNLKQILLGDYCGIWHVKESILKNY